MALDRRTNMPGMTASKAEGRPLIQIRSFESPFEAEAREALAAALPDFVRSQRWYRAKAKTIRRITVEDAIPIGRRFFAAVIRIAYTDNEHEIYLLPLAVGAGLEGAAASDVVARLQSEQGEEQLLHNALVDAEFRTMLLDAISRNMKFSGSGELVCARTEAFQGGEKSSWPESKVSRAEQSNSSIIFGNQYILKLFRKLESGINPDIEVGRFLTRQKFAHTPAVLGEIKYQTREAGAASDETWAGILQGFVANEGDAWKHALESIQGFFERALERPDAPQLEESHPLVLVDSEQPALVRQTIGDYLDAARLLGTRTAEMHAALSSDQSDPDFAPEPFTGEYAEVLYREMVHEADRTFTLLREKADSLPGDASGYGRRLLGSEDDVRSRFENLRERPISAKRIRHHGDYHLGQVLFTGDDFVIIDFEGEPARPLAARRLKTLAMRDVAGMIRSFSYAGYAAASSKLEGVSADESRRQALEKWAAFWSTWVSAAYLKGYLEEAEGSLFAGSDRAEQRILLDAFLLQKALYETSYELNNRPDWVQIPLRGILSLID